jgi:phage baseplate assembly protein W
MPVDLGTDVRCFPSLDPYFRAVSGNQAVAECLFRRTTTPKGRMKFHPDDGMDLHDYLNGPVTALTLARCKSEVEAQCMRDERVKDVAVFTEWDSDKEALAVDISFTTAEGPFRFVLEVTALEVRMVEAQ